MRSTLRFDIRRWFRLALLLAIFSVTSDVQSASAQGIVITPRPPMGRAVRIRTKLALNKVVGISQARMDNGAPTHLWDYLAVPDEEWVIYVDGYSYRIQAVHSQKCLDLAGGTSLDGGQIQQWDCVGNGNQKWSIEPQNDGWVIRSSVSNKCLEVAGSGTANGTVVYQMTCSGANNQRWQLDDVVLPPVGWDLLIRNVQSSWKALCIYGALPDNGARTHMWDYLGYPDQKWRIEDAGQGYYRLKVQHTQKCLDLSNGSTAPGAQVQQWDCQAGNINQLWRVEKVNDYWRLRPKAAGNCLSVATSSIQNGTIASSWPCSWTNDQYWYIDTL